MLARVLGWIAVIGSPLVIIAAIVAVHLESESYIILWRVAWLPFVFAWGIRQLRQSKIS